jgi:hypothetical protein
MAVSGLGGEGVAPSFTFKNRLAGLAGNFDG